MCKIGTKQKMALAMMKAMCAAQRIKPWENLGGGCTPFEFAKSLKPKRNGGKR